MSYSMISIRKRSISWSAGGMSKEEAEREAPIMKEAQQMLVDWEAGKPEVIELVEDDEQLGLCGF